MLNPEQRARALIEAALAIFEQAYPRPTPQDTTHNNPVWEWMARARAELATQHPTAAQGKGVEQWTAHTHHEHRCNDCFADGCANCGECAAGEKAVADYVLVPREPTEEMIVAYFETRMRNYGEDTARAKYQAMLAAAPSAPDAPSVQPGAGNYTADQEIYPKTVTFADGRVVSVVGDGYLTVGRTPLPPTHPNEEPTT